ncbi:MAG: type IX secretion system membrane protein PorP/SprF [Bacteroidota bacterium]
MKKIIYIIFFLFTAALGFAQQEGHFTHFMYNQQTFNPGYVGSRGVPSITALYRNQWLDIEGAPQNIAVSYDSPFLDDRVGFGLNIVNQGDGRFDTWNASMAYSYGIPVSEGLTIRIGLQGTAEYTQIDLSDPTILDPNGSDDPSIMTASLEPTQLKGNVGAGIYLHSERFYFGISSPRFLSNEIGFNENTDVVTAFRVAHYYAMAGFTVPMSEKVKLRPAFMGKYVQGAPFQLDANLSAIFSDKFTLGASYRTGGSGTGESVDFLLMLQLSKRMGLGVAYDFTLSDLKDYNNGTFELMLRYDFKLKRSDLENGRDFSGNSKSKKSASSKKSNNDKSKSKSRKRR